MILVAVIRDTASARPTAEENSPPPRH
jgi:hypothetical protein